MVKRIAPIRASVFLVLATCGALCQTERPAVGLLEAGDSNSLKVQIQGKDTWMSFPDAPSTLLPTRADRFHTFVVEARSTRTRAMVGSNPLALRETDLDHVASRPQCSFSTPDKKVSSGYGSSTFLDRYLYPSLLRRNLHYRPSSSSGLLGRASYAASRIFITHDGSGKARLNSSYFLGALTSVAIHTAYRPYWTRSPSGAFNSFGATLGSDAGINLFREFAPGIRQLVRDHPAKRGPGPAGPNTHEQKPGEVVSATVR